MAALRHHITSIYLRFFINSSLAQGHHSALHYLSQSYFASFVVLYSSKTTSRPCNMQYGFSLPLNTRRIEFCCHLAFSPQVFSCILCISCTRRADGGEAKKTSVFSKYGFQQSIPTLTVCCTLHIHFTLTFTEKGWSSSFRPALVKLVTGKFRKTGFELINRIKEVIDDNIKFTVTWFKNKDKTFGPPKCPVYFRLHWVCSASQSLLRELPLLCIAVIMLLI